MTSEMKNFKVVLTDGKRSQTFYVKAFGKLQAEKKALFLADNVTYSPFRKGAASVSQVLEHSEIPSKR